MIQERQKTIVRLAAYEQMMAVQVGTRRQLVAEQRRSKPRFDAQYVGQLYINHIMGACAEVAVAKYLGAYWDGSVDVGARADIPSWNVDVRFSPTRPKVKENDTCRIVGVLPLIPPPNCNACEFVIVGWHNPDEVRERKDWFHAGDPPCWFPKEWRDIATLERPVE
jgi:hypothetical protein